MSITWKPQYGRRLKFSRLTSTRLRFSSGRRWPLYLFFINVHCRQLMSTPLHFSWSTSTRLSFSWSTLTRLSFSSGQRSTSDVDAVNAVDVHFYWCFHHAPFYDYTIHMGIFGYVWKSSVNISIVSWHSNQKPHLKQTWLRKSPEKSRLETKIQYLIFTHGSLNCYIYADPVIWVLRFGIRCC